MHMLYCVLFHGTFVELSAASPKESFAASTLQVALQSLRFFNSFALLDLSAFQVGLVPKSQAAAWLLFSVCARVTVLHCLF